MRKSSMQQSQIQERVEFDQQQIQKKSVQLKDKLLLGHQKSQLKYKNGIVFIGNSRVGKSTLAAILNGIEMRKRLNGNVVVIQPSEERYRNQANLIQHSFTSVTSYPNIKEMQIDGQYYTIVDLPGFMDTSYQKQLCNWAYIKNILEQLQKILFVMVLHVHSQTLTIKDDELSMMKRFKQAFPTSEKFKPKENLCMIVNFVQGIETQQKETLMKEKILKEMQRQLNEDIELNSFYMKSLEKSRVLVIERARKDQSMDINPNSNNNNHSYTIPKLLPFIKSNLNKLQAPQASQHKLCLPISSKKQSQQLREIIRYLMQSTISQISQRINEYKIFLSQVLSILSQTAGAELGKQNIVRLENYQFKKKLTKYGKIQLRKQFCSQKNNNSNWSQSQFQQHQQLNQQQLSSSTTQHTIFTIIQLLNQINNTKHFEQTKHGLNNLLQKIMLFYKYIQKLATNLFNNNQQVFKQFMSITENIKKSIYIDCLDMICLNENVQDFLIPIVSQNEQVSFYQLMKDALFESYDSIIRISMFKQSLKKYIDNLLRQYQEVSKQNVGMNKIDVGTLKRLSNVCQLTNLKQLQLKAAILRFIIEHKKVKNINFVKNLDLLHNVLCSINNNNKNSNNQLQHQQNYTNQQQQQIQKWKHQNQQQWQSIKGKNFIFMLNILTKTGYQNKKQLLKFYLDSNITTQYQQILRLLKQLINEDVQQNNCDRFTVYGLCMEAKQKMLKQWDIHGAMACCKLAEKLYVFQDKKRFLQARKQYIELVKLSMKIGSQMGQEQQQQRSMVMNNEMNDYIQGLGDQSWSNISDQLYDKLIQTVDQHCLSVMLANKQKLMSSQSISPQQHINSSHNKNLNNITIVNMNKMFSSPGRGEMTNIQSITRFSQNVEKKVIKNNNNMNDKVSDKNQNSNGSGNKTTTENILTNKITGNNGSQNKKVESNNNILSEGGQSPPQPQKKLRGFRMFK